MRVRRRTLGWVAFLLLVVVSVAGCRGGMPSRLRPPTLTPILLSTVTQPPPATPVARKTAAATRTPAQTATPTASAPGRTTPLVATGSSTPTPMPSATLAPTPVHVAAPATRPARAPASSRQIGKIAFQSASGGNIYLLPAAGGPAQRVTSGLDPALSPDGTRLAFARWGASPGIYVLDLATGEERQVAGAEQPRSPSWRSDGETLVFSRSLGTTSCRQSPFGCLSEDELRARFGGQDCIQTPFGRFCISDFPLVEQQRSGLTRVGANGAGWLDLPAGPDSESPAWRPGSDDILFLGDGRLQLTGPDRTPRPLASDPWTLSPAWSPDGSRVAAQRRVHDAWEIVLLDSQGTTLKYLTSGSGNNVSPTWSSDGKSILFLSNRGGPWRFYRMNPDGSAQAPFRTDALRDIEMRYDYASERVASWGP